MKILFQDADATLAPVIGTIFNLLINDTVKLNLSPAAIYNHSGTALFQVAFDRWHCRDLENI